MSQRLVERCRCTRSSAALGGLAKRLVKTRQRLAVRSQSRTPAGAILLVVAGPFTGGDAPAARSGPIALDREATAPVLSLRHGRFGLGTLMMDEQRAPGLVARLRARPARSRTVASMEIGSDQERRPDRQMTGPPRDRAWTMDERASGPAPSSRPRLLVPNQVAVYSQTACDPNYKVVISDRYRHEG